MRIREATGSSNGGFIYHCPEAARTGTQGLCDGCDQPLAAQDQPPSDCFCFHAACAGPAHRRPQQRGTVSVHDPGRQCRRPLSLGTDPAGEHEEAARAVGREYRPAERRPAGDAHLRSRHGCASGADRAIAGSIALPRVRTVRGFRHLHAAESVLRSDGSCTAVLAESYAAEQHLLQAVEWECNHRGTQHRFTACSA